MFLNFYFLSRAGFLNNSCLFICIRVTFILFTHTKALLNLAAPLKELQSKSIKGQATRSKIQCFSQS